MRCFGSYGLCAPHLKKGFGMISSASTELNRRGEPFPLAAGLWGCETPTAGTNVASRDAGRCVWRWAIPQPIVSACEDGASIPSGITWAKSSTARRSVPWTRRQPANGSTTRPRCAGPCRAYASSRRSGCSGAAGMGTRGSATRGVLGVSMHTCGRWGALGYVSTASTASMAQTTAAWAGGGIPHGCGDRGVSTLLGAWCGPTPD